MSSLQLAKYKLDTCAGFNKKNVVVVTCYVVYEQSFCVNYDSYILWKMGEPYWMEEVRDLGCDQLKLLLTVFQSKGFARAGVSRCTIYGLSNASLP